MSIVVGWHAAAARAGLPRTTLRRLVAKGQLVASKDTSGTWTFEADALDRLREERTQGALAGAVAASSPVGPPMNAPTAMPSATAPIALAPWMVAAADARNAAFERDAHVADHDDQDDGERREPFTGVPLGSSKAAMPGASWPYSAVAGTTSTVSLRISELEQQLADAIAHRDRWYRAGRIKSIADTIATEAMAASGDIHAAQAAAHAAAQALSALPLDQLALDSVAFPLAQHFGHQVGTSWAQAAYHHRNANDIERARTRRSRSRSLRW